MGMSKKDFIALADDIKRMKGTEAEFNKDQLAILAGFCENVNPNFNRNRWFDYIAGVCGSSGGKRK